MALTIEEILEKTTPRVEEVRVCLDGQLLGEHKRLTQQLDEVQRPGAGRKMSDKSEAREIAQRVVDIEAEIEKAKQPFTFAALSPAKQGEIRSRFPGKGPGGWDVEKGAAAYIAAASVEPKMTEAQAEQLCIKLGSGGATELFNAAWNATNEGTSPPLSVRASALIGGSGSK